MEKKRSSFTGRVGFVLAAAGSARIWIAAAILIAGVGAVCLIGRGLYGFWNQKHKE